MSDIDWQNGAACYAYGKQWFVRDNEDNDLISKEGNAFANSSNVLMRTDFQLNEIREGDFIQASELDTEQKYNEVVEVFWLFGFKKDKYSLSYSKLAVGATHYLASKDYGIDSVSTNLAFKNYCKDRQLTYNQIIAIGKLKRMMLEREKSAPKTTTDLTPDKQKSAVDYLNECVEVQKQRGEQYDSSGTGERSFSACADAYNAITGGKLKGSDICLIFQILKDVRQYSNPSRLHEDSVLDKVSYSSLHAEELNKELK